MRLAFADALNVDQCRPLYWYMPVARAVLALRLRRRMRASRQQMSIGLGGFRQRTEDGQTILQSKMHIGSGAFLQRKRSTSGRMRLCCKAQRQSARKL